IGDGAGPQRDHARGLRRLHQQADQPEGFPRHGEGAARGDRVSEGANILVVDDTPQNVKLLADVLSFRGYRVETATSGEEALGVIAERLPDIVLLDVMMPGMSGYDVCRRLR